MTPQMASQMTPQDAPNGTERRALATPATMRAHAPAGATMVETPTAARAPAPGPRELTFAELQTLALSWVGMTVTLLLLLGGLALWAAVALRAGFGGWLLGTGLLGLFLVTVVGFVNYLILRTTR